VKVFSEDLCDTTVEELFGDVFSTPSYRDVRRKCSQLFKGVCQGRVELSCLESCCSEKHGHFKNPEEDEQASFESIIRRLVKTVADL
jgi:hypothetical protein